jgi:hypothetical protein
MPQKFDVQQLESSLVKVMRACGGTISVPSWSGDRICIFDRVRTLNITELAKMIIRENEA